VGLDFSAGLLDEARRGLPEGSQVVFQQVDLSSAAWGEELPRKSFQAALAFAVLHHIPGLDLRRQILRRVHDLLLPGGFFVLSNWQFLNSPRLRGRVQPWEAAGLSPAQVEAGDFLLDWRQGGAGLRYVHHFDLQELLSLAAETSFEVLESYLSDGENNQLSIYQIWKPVE
jgi:SAM-dependent methyltransferase